MNNGLNDLKEKIRDDNIPILVELFDWSTLAETFHENIASCYEVFYPFPVNNLNEPDTEYEKF